MSALLCQSFRRVLNINVASGTRCCYYSSSHHQQQRKKSPLLSFTFLDEEIEDACRRYENQITIESISRATEYDDDWGVIATRAFSKGETVVSAKAIGSSAPIRGSHTIQKNWGEHVLMDLPARFLNHSCDPNVGVQDNKFGAYDFVALRNVLEGEEISYNYESTEYKISAFETCLCGSKNCRGHVTGFKDAGYYNNGGQLLRKHCHGKYIANYLLNKK